MVLPWEAASSSGFDLADTMRSRSATAQSDDRPDSLVRWLGVGPAKRQTGPARGGHAHQSSARFSHAALRESSFPQRIHERGERLLERRNVIERVI